MKNIPKWVKQLDETDPNKTIYLQLIENGDGGIETPREINFSIKDISSSEDAENIVEYCKKKKWHSGIYKDSEDESKFWVECSKKSYVISERRVDEDEAFFSKIANMYNADYDGWYASVE